MILALKNFLNDIESNKIIELLKNGGLYFGTAAIGMLLSFFTFPIFSTFLTEQDFAIFNYFNNLSGFFVFAFSLQFTSYFSARYFRSSEEEKKILTSTLISFSLMWLPLIVVIVYTCLMIYCRLIAITLPFYPYLLFSLLLTALPVIKGLYLVRLRLEGDANKYFLINSAHKVLGVGLSLILTIYMYNHLIGRFWGLLIIEIAVTVLCIGLIYKNASFYVNKIELKRALKFIYPLIGASLVYYPITGLDQIVLERLGDTKELGYYSLGLTFAAYLYMFNSSMLLALEPIIIRSTIHKNFRKLFVTIVSFVTFCILGTYIFTEFSSVLIDFLTSGRYVVSAKYSNILAISFIFLITFSIANIMLIALQLNKAAFYTNLIGCICSFIIYIFSANQFGFYGVAIGRILLFAILSIVACIFIYYELNSSKLNFQNASGVRDL